jgi:peptide deformylase
MANLQIRTVPDSILRQKAKRVTVIDKSIQRLIDDMIETMREASGVGLAAPQVGVSLRVVVIEIPDEDVITLINPEIIKKEGEHLLVEGCLSIPGYQAMVNRSVKVKVKAQDRNGKMFRIKGEDLLAQALEHEIDHLNGILYIDHLRSTDDLKKITTEGQGL